MSLSICSSREDIIARGSFGRDVSRGDSAVHREGLAREEGRFIGSKKRRCLSDFSGFGDPAQGIFHVDFLAHRFWVRKAIEEILE